MQKRMKWKRLGALVASCLLIVCTLCSCALNVGGTNVSSSDSSIDSSSDNSLDSSSDNSLDSSSGNGVEQKTLTIHTFPFNNLVSGDCTLIKYGDVEVLIDAGSTKGSASKTVVPYLKEYCTDGVLEYVVATHADSDHIYSFVGEFGQTGNDGVFANFQCQTIIDFPKTTKTTQLYKDYVALRDKEVKEGAVHYTALECYRETNGAKRMYTLGEDVEMRILYQKYYVDSTANENNNSVCLMISHKDQHFLFTGDLESQGEKSLVESNVLPKCVYFKAGHHGSDTANSVDLLSVITPSIVVISACVNDKFGFPHQAFFNNVAPYTDRVYVPGMKDSKGAYALLNGCIIVQSTGDSVEVVCSNNDTKIKDTEWFKSERTCPSAWKNVA